MQAFIHREFTGIHNGTTKKRFGPIACINAVMQQHNHSFTQKSKHSQQKNKRGFAPFLHAEIKGAEPDSIRSKEGLKLRL